MKCVSKKYSPSQSLLQPNILTAIQAQPHETTINPNTATLSKDKERHTTPATTVTAKGGDTAAAGGVPGPPSPAVASGGTSAQMLQHPNTHANPGTSSYQANHHPHCHNNHHHHHHSQQQRHSKRSSHRQNSVSSRHGSFKLHKVRINPINRRSNCGSTTPKTPSYYLSFRQREKILKIIIISSPFKKQT